MGRKKKQKKKNFSLNYGVVIDRILTDWELTCQYPRENGYCESFNGKLRDELLNGELFYTLREAQVLIEQWRVFYNTERPHSSLGYRPPAPETVAPREEFSNQQKQRKLT